MMRLHNEIIIIINNLNKTMIEIIARILNQKSNQINCSIKESHCRAFNYYHLSLIILIRQHTNTQRLFMVENPTTTTCTD